MKKISFSDVCDLTACVLRGEVTNKVMPVTIQSQPTYAVGETVAVAQCLRDLGYDANDRSDGNIYGLNHTLAWTMKSHVSASQCKHFIKITGRQVKRLQDITDEEILHSGVFNLRHILNTPPMPYKELEWHLYGFFNFIVGYETPREAFASMINKTQKKGFWESNTWVIIYSFELVNKD